MTSRRRKNKDISKNKIRGSQASFSSRQADAVSIAISEMHFGTKQKTMKYARDEIKFELFGNFKPVVIFHFFYACLLTAIA